MWEIEYTDEFGEWWDTLNLDERDAVTFSVDLLERNGPLLKFPHSTTSRRYGRKVLARKFAELRAQISPERRARIDEEVERAMAEMPLNELRNARGLSQQMLAEAMRIQQPAIAKIEKRTDMYISTLRSHIRAMGGELEIIARFPEGDVKISNFSQI